MFCMKVLPAIASIPDFDKSGVLPRRIDRWSKIAQIIADHAEVMHRFGYFC